MSLLDNLNAEASHLIKELEPEFRPIAALVWRDAKSVAKNVGAAASNLGSQDLVALKNMALQIVTSTEKDPSFKDAIGSWKLGHACMMLVTQLGKGLLANIPKLAQDTVETLIQTAFASMVTRA